MNNSVELTDLVRTLLHTLLDRYEQPDRRTVVRVRLNKREHAAYFSQSDIAPRRDSNTAFQQLAAVGWLNLHWQKWEEGNWLAMVDLVSAQVAQIYALVARSPRSTQVAELATLLAAECARPGWHAAFLAWATSQLTNGQSLAPLAVTDLSFSTDLLRALTALADLRQPTLERTLSVRIFGDSKRLDTLRSAIVRVLREHDLSAAAFGSDQWALLRAHNLDRVPEYIPMAGPLELALAGGQTIDLAPFLPSIALSASMLYTAIPTACAAKALVSVENSTSFSELLAVRPSDLIVVYSGGFASPSLVRLLLRLRTLRPDLPFGHWGDLDAGGLRILAHLRSQLGPVVPIAMDVTTFYRHQQQSKPLTSRDRTLLAELQQHPALSDCSELLTALLAADAKLEQEALTAATILNTLSDTWL